MQFCGTACAANVKHAGINSRHFFNYLLGSNVHWCRSYSLLPLAEDARNCRRTRTSILLLSHAWSSAPCSLQYSVFWQECCLQLCQDFYRWRFRSDVGESDGWSRLVAYPFLSRDATPLWSPYICRTNKTPLSVPMRARTQHWRKNDRASCPIGVSHQAARSRSETVTDKRISITICTSILHKKRDATNFF